MHILFYMRIVVLTNGNGAYVLSKKHKKQEACATEVTASLALRYLEKLTC